MDLSTLLSITAVRSVYVGNRMVDYSHAADVTFAFVSILETYLYANSRLYKICAFDTK